MHSCRTPLLILNPLKVWLLAHSFSMICLSLSPLSEDFL